jgi:hypothetical protein
MFRKVLNVIQLAAALLLRISELDFCSFTALCQSGKGAVFYYMV